MFARNNYLVLQTKMNFKRQSYDNNNNTLNNLIIIIIFIIFKNHCWKNFNIHDYKLEFYKGEKIIQNGMN